VPRQQNIIGRVTAPDKEWTMPQARSAGSSQKKPAAKRAPAKAAAKPAAAKSAAAKPATAAKSAAAKRARAKSAAAKPAAKRTAATASSAKPAASKAAASEAAASKAKPRVTIRVKTDGVQIEAIVERLRKLNEKIIDVGREAGESTLTSYEKALKTIATGISQSSAKDELEWIQHLAASQAKFVREITESWAKAARERLK
jgi:chemotaxis protein histidine kinase CheA